MIQDLLVIGSPVLVGGNIPARVVCFGSEPNHYHDIKVQFENGYEEWVDEDDISLKEEGQND